MDNSRLTNIPIINKPKDELWHRNEVQTQSDPMIDTETGKPYVIRQFEFSFNPETIRKIREKQIPAPTQQELFNSNWDQIRKILWADGLVAMQEKDYPPRLVIGKKKYKIFILCEPRQGTIVVDKIKNLNQVLDTKK